MKTNKIETLNSFGKFVHHHIIPSGVSNFLLLRPRYEQHKKLTNETKTTHNQ